MLVTLLFEVKTLFSLKWNIIFTFTSYHDFFIVLILFWELSTEWGKFTIIIKYIVASNHCIDEALKF